MKRFKTDYPGVYYILGVSPITGKEERIYYIRYRKDGKMVEEKAGRQIKDAMTPAKASQKRAQKITGKAPTNKEKRRAELEKKKANNGRWTIDRLWNEYRKNRRPGKALNTDSNRYKNYLKREFGKKEPSDIIALDTDRLRIRLLKTKSPQTVKHVLNLLTWIINFGVNKGLCGGLSFKMQKPTVNNVKTEDLTDEQLKKLIVKIEEDDHLHAGPMMKMALFTGMRRGELFKLKWKDIDFEKGFITLVDPKGGPDQKIPLNDGARDLLEKHPKISRYVFPGRKGSQRTEIAKQVRSIADAAGLPKTFRPLHGLRHTYASMLASSGEVDMYTLQKLMTHKDPKMTQRYAHLRDDALKRASNLAGSIIEQATNKKPEEASAESEVVKSEALNSDASQA